MNTRARRTVLCACTASLVILILILVNACVGKTGPGGSPLPTATSSPTPMATPVSLTGSQPNPAATVAPGIDLAQGWREKLLVSDYLWVIDGERVDRAPRLSPDGKRIVVLPTANRGDRHGWLAVMDIDTGRVKEITPDKSWGHASAHWSPDGQRLAFVRFRYDRAERLPTETEVWVMDADGGNARRLWQGEVGWPGINGPSAFVNGWTLDGAAVAIGGTIWGGGVGGFRVVLKADGSGQVAFPWPKTADLGLSEGDAWHLCTLSPRGDFVLATAYSPATKWPTPTPENYRSSIVRYDFATRQATTLVSMPDSLWLGPLSPDGRRLCFTSAPPPGSRRDEPPRSWVIGVDGNGLKEIGGDPRQVAGSGNVCWSGNGSHLFFTQSVVHRRLSPGSSDLCVLDAASGATNLIRRGPLQNLVDVSGDGKRVLFIAGEWERAQIWLLERK